MRNTVGNVFCYIIVAMLFLPPFSLAAGSGAYELKKCDTSNATAITDQCGPNERCIRLEGEVSAACHCLRDYEFVDGKCVAPQRPVETTTVVPEPHSAESGGSSVAAGLLIPIALIFVAALLYYGARRYKWLQRLRQYHQSRYGNVLVTRNDDDDDDDDDPPIA